MRFVAKSEDAALAMSLYDQIPLHSETPSIRLLEFRIDGDVTDQLILRGRLTTLELSDDLRIRVSLICMGESGCLALHRAQRLSFRGVIESARRFTRIAVKTEREWKVKKAVDRCN